MLGRFSDILRDMLPRNGRMITERGTFINEADHIERLKVGSDTFGNTNVAEYTPILERKPLPAFSNLRDSVAGDGSVVVEGGELKINGTESITTLYTREYGRYIPGTYGVAGIGVRLNTPGTGTYEYGYGNGSGNRMGMEVIDGEYFTYLEADNVRYYRKPRSQWLDPLDGTGSSGLVMNENQHIFRIVIGWYGYLSINFYIVVTSREGGDKQVLIDRSEPQDGVSVQQPDLPIFAEANGGILYVGGRQFGIYGRYRPEFRNTGAISSNASVETTFVPLCSFRIKDTVAWKGVSVSISGSTVASTQNAYIAIIIGGTLTGAVFGSVPGIDAGETALEHDDTATAITGGYRAFVDTVVGGAANRSGIIASNIPDLQIPRDSIVTLAVRAVSTTASVQATFRMREEW